MKKIISTAIISGALSFFLTIPTFAGQWMHDTHGWWYAHSNGSYATNRWELINDKYYYFNSNGYMLENTITPDGYYVGMDGAWDGKEKASPSVVGRWTIDTNRFVNLNGMSPISAFGHYNYDDYLILNADGTVRWTAGSFVGGNGVYSVSNDKITMNYQDYDGEASTKDIFIENSYETMCLMMPYGDCIIPWILE